MHNPLPDKFDLHHEFSHPKFDEILGFFKPAIADFDKCSVRAIIDGAVNGSDIKWNNLSGKWRLSVIREKKEILSLIGCQIDCFTGNCGVKSIDHLYLYQHPYIKQDAAYVEKCREMLQILESFLYHQTNCGWLIGSDTKAKYMGSTLQNIELYGTGYEQTKPVWNPNYTWDRTHNIAIFTKDLNAVEHTPYW